MGSLIGNPPRGRLGHIGPSLQHPPPPGQAESSPPRGLPSEPLALAVDAAGRVVVTHPAAPLPGFPGVAHRQADTQSQLAGCLPTQCHGTVWRLIFQAEKKGKPSTHVFGSNLYGFPSMDCRRYKGTLTGVSFGLRLSVCSSCAQVFV